MPYIGRSGELLYIGAQVAGGPVANITATSNSPVVRVNKIAVTMGPAVWTNASHECPFVAYRFPTPVRATDVVDYTLEAGAITTASGVSDAVTTPTIVSNYVGRYEPGFGGFSGFAPNRRMPVGMNFLPAGFHWYEPLCLAKNLRRKMSSPWTNQAGTSAAVYETSDSGLLNSIIGLQAVSSPHFFGTRTRRTASRI